jgi:hypothetical protein
MSDHLNRHHDRLVTRSKCLKARLNRLKKQPDRLVNKPKRLKLYHNRLITILRILFADKKKTKENTMISFV